MQKKLDQYAVPCGYKIRDKFEIKLSGKRDIESLKKEREGFVTRWWSCNGNKFLK